MEALKLSGVAQQGKLILDVPDRFNQQELEVIVLSHTSFGLDDAATGQKEKLEKMLNIIGSAEYPNTQTSKYDVYDQ